MLFIIQKKEKSNNNRLSTSVNPPHLLFVYFISSPIRFHKTLRHKIWRHWFFILIKVAYIRLYKIFTQVCMSFAGFSSLKAWPIWSHIFHIPGIQGKHFKNFCKRRLDLWALDLQLINAKCVEMPSGRHFDNVTTTFCVSSLTISLDNNWSITYFLDFLTMTSLFLGDLGEGFDLYELWQCYTASCESRSFE